MDVSVYYKKNNMEILWKGSQEKQSQTKPISRPVAGNPKSEYLNPKRRHVIDTFLKKQSQFAGEQIGVKSYLKGCYGNNPPCGLQKNKANQSQFRVESGSVFCVRIILRTRG